MSLSVLSYDELNTLVGMKRSEPFDQYFEPMKLSVNQKKKRKRLAERLEEEFIYMLALLFYSYPNIRADAATELRDRYISALEGLGIATAIATSKAEKETELRLQATKFATDVVDVTQRHKDEPYYYSKDRARLASEDQANFVYDISDYSDAIANGNRYKTWEIVGDGRERESHAEVAGLTIPIEDVFVLQGGLLRHPHDASLGASEEELCGCRCSISYS